MGMISVAQWILDSTRPKPRSRCVRLKRIVGLQIIAPKHRLYEEVTVSAETHTLGDNKGTPSKAHRMPLN